MRYVTFLAAAVGIAATMAGIFHDRPRRRPWLSWVGLILCCCLFGFLLPLFVSGCAAHQPPSVVVAAEQPVVDVPATLGLVGQNEGYHGPVLAEVVDHDCARSAAPFAYRSPQVTVAGAQALLESITRCDHLVLDVLIERDDRALAAALGAWAVSHPDRVVAIECGNELDITALDRGPGQPRTLDAEQFATWVYDCTQALRAAGYGRDIVSGGVYALTDETWTYLQPTIKVCRMLGCLMGLHDYDNFDTTWMDRLAQSGVRWVLSETGAPSATPDADRGQAAFLEEACAGASHAQVAGFFVYQGPSGPGTSNLDHFGTRAFTLPGAPLQFKPADAVLTRLAQGRC